MTDGPWAATSRRPRLFLAFDDIYLVYDHLSGQTHCLNFLAFTILQAAEEATIDLSNLSDLSVELSRRLDMPAEEFDQSVVDAAIGELARLGLIGPDRRIGSLS